MVEDNRTAQSDAGSIEEVSGATASPPLPAFSRVNATTIAGVTTRVQSYTQEEAVRRARVLTNEVNARYFELGGTLQRIRAEKWYSPHKTFKAYLSDLGLPYRRANYFMTIFAVMTREGIEWSRFADLGWTKMVCLTDVITADNAETWLEAAAANSRGQLQAIVSDQLSRSRPRLERSAERSSSRRDEMLTSDPLVALPARRSRRPVAVLDSVVVERPPGRDDLASRLAVLKLREFSTLIVEALAAQDDHAVRFFIRVLAQSRRLSVNFI